MKLTLTERAWEELRLHAMETFPEECCGIILANGASDRVRRCVNVQNRLHALDPQTYPRDATIAYAMDPKELQAILRESETTGAKIKAFYHSHPNHDAYFSEEDKAFACPFGEPAYPDSAQIVVSIYDRAVKEVSAYAWDQGKEDFVEIPIQTI